MSEDGYKPLRDKKGRWLKGTSANPGGRPPGTRNRVAQRIFDKLEPDMEGVLRTLQTAALNGDTQSARFLLSLYVPRARQAHADIGTELPPLDPAENIAMAHAAIVNAAATGRIDGDTASALSALLSEQRKSHESTALERKLNRLESGKVIDLSGLEPE